MATHSTLAPESHDPVTSARTERLVRAALGGLLGLGAAACNSPAAEPDPCHSETDAGAPFDSGHGHGGNVDAGPVGGGTSGPVVLSEVEGDRTYASLRADCDARGGYVQIHGACAGVNACAGFSYGDWDPGVLSEHTCAGINGCNGLSCVVLPEDAGRTGAEILALELPESGPRACSSCHARHTDDMVDTTVFRVFRLPGSGVTPDNWLDGVTAAAQERIVAFGSTGQLPDGQAFAHMASYRRILSRAEIERVVQHIRTNATIEIVEYRIMD